MSKKYQIFISSTFEDLREEREALIKIILQLGDIPVGMEMFNAGDDEQWRIIQSHISTIDYYAVVVAHRYGSVGTDGISYTEKEYEYAKSLGVPIIGFLIDPNAPWDHKKKENTNQDKLEAFKEKVQSKMVNYWKNKDELTAKFVTSLVSAKTTHPRDGLVPASKISSQEVFQKMTALTVENEDLKKELQKYKTDENPKVVQMFALLRTNEDKIKYKFESGSRWSHSYPVKFLRLFDVIAPKLSEGASFEQIYKYLPMMINPTNKKLHKEVPIPFNYLEIIFSKFMALGLVSGDKTSYHLTQFGEEVYGYSVREKFISNARKKETDTDFSDII